MAENEVGAFTGIVVRTGNPVVLDKGSERLVLELIDGNCSLELGAKVTAQPENKDSQWNINNRGVFRESTYSKFA